MSEKDDDRSVVYVHAESRSDDAARVFYEVPDRIADEVRSCATFDGETFASCLVNIVLEREGALGEVTRLKRLLHDHGGPLDARADRGSNGPDARADRTDRNDQRGDDGMSERIGEHEYDEATRIAADIIKRHYRHAEVGAARDGDGYAAYFYEDDHGRRGGEFRSVGGFPTVSAASRAIPFIVAATVIEDVSVWDWDSADDPDPAPL